MTVQKLIAQLPDQTSFSAQPRAYTNHAVQFKTPSTPEQRMKLMEAAGLNVFFFPAEMISGCDLLSDSGTTTMTDAQWAALHLGDEAYGSNRGYFALMEQIADVFGGGFAQPDFSGAPNAFLFHQGRPAEDALCSVLATLGQNLIIPSNGHFDTTLANVEAHGMEARQLFSPKLQESGNAQTFRGDMDVQALAKLLETSADRVPVIYTTITNNTGGGQPVSMQNIKAVHELSRRYHIPFMLDACRFAENAWFIKHYEKGYKDKTIREIAREMFSYADGFTISFKKDGLANMGGGLFLKRGGMFIEKYPQLQDTLMNLQIIKEGHPTYGGMSGRDIMALAEGLRTVTTDAYLDARIGQVQTFGQQMAAAGLPVLEPAGGHAVYLDMDKFFAGTDMKPEDFGGIAFTALLLAQYGHRACELGNFAFGEYDAATGKETWPAVNFVRFAVPRLRYEAQDLASVVEAVKALHDARHFIPKIDVLYGRELPLRHFKARFAFQGE